MFVPGSDGTPGPVRGLGHESGANRVREDVLERGAEVVFVVDDPRREACREEGAAAAVAGIVLSRIVPLEPLGGAREVCRPGSHDRVVVRPHQAVAMEVEHEARRGATEERQEHAPILRVAEQHRLVHAPGGHVEVAVRKLRAEDARHGVDARSQRWAPEIDVSLPPHFRHAFGRQWRVSDTPRGRTSLRPKRQPLGGHGECQTLAMTEGEVA